MLETFLANLRTAVLNRESVSIGGGTFTPEELLLVLKAVTFLKDSNANS